MGNGQWAMGDGRRRQDIGNTFWFEGNTFLDCFLDFVDLLIKQYGKDLVLQECRLSEYC